MKFLIFRYALVAAWMLVIFLFSQQPASESSAQSGVIVQAVVNTVGAGWPEDIVTFVTRKSAHTFLYFVLGGLLLNVARQYRLRTWQMLVISILCALGYAVTDELHQTFVPGRSGEVRDVAIDTTAAAMGAGAVYLLVARRDRLSKKRAEKI